MVLPKYNPKTLEEEVERKWYSAENPIFNWKGDSPKEKNFVIDTPPPTVSGSLHIGHVFSYTQTDFIARYQRMRGKDVFYPIGFDDNGLPTERLVEKVSGKRAMEMERSEFQALCKKTIKKYEKEFEALFKRCGISFDWRYKYQTVSDQSAALSQMSFLDLYNKGLIFRKKAPTFWDWVDQTAIAQAEIEDKERQSVMNYIYFELFSDDTGVEGATTIRSDFGRGTSKGDTVEDDSADYNFTADSNSTVGEKIEIATTRPELLPACSAVFYHPEDPRYKHLKGRSAIVPIFEAVVPILPDEDVEVEKGSGLVMCCTYGDFQDVEWQKKHNLAVHECVGFNGRMRNAGLLDGMKIKAARTHIINLLKEGRYLNKQVDITQTVKCAERSGEVLEIIPTDQWYIELLPYKKELHEQINKCKWHPNFMKQRAEIWNENLNQNWCISRQRYFGVPIPVWYSKRQGEEGKILLPDPNQLPVDPIRDLPEGYEREEVVGERDILDTWATSSITPSLASGIINEQYHIKGYKALLEASSEKDVEHKKLQLMPCDLRPQSHEIIRIWAYSTIAKSWMHNNEIPWTDLAISGWCLARDNSKMSKTKNNAIDPKKLLDEYGTDVVRYWASTSKLGVDIAFSEDTLKVGKKLTRKLWNASKFVCSQTEKLFGDMDLVAKELQELASELSEDINLGDSDLRYSNKTLNEIATSESLSDLIKTKKIHEKFDLWIISKLSKVIEESTNLLENYDFSAARMKIEDFFWKDFCDNYLEIVKKRSYGSHENYDISVNERNSFILLARNSALYTMRHCLEVLLRLFMPYIPHIASELYGKIYDAGVFEKTANWPSEEDCYYNRELLEEGDVAVSIVEAVRKEKTLKQVAMNYPLYNLEYNAHGLKAEGLDKSFERDILKAINLVLRDAELGSGIKKEFFNPLITLEDDSAASAKIFLESKKKEHENMDCGSA